MPHSPLSSQPNEAWRWYNATGGALEESGGVMANAVIIAPTNNPRAPLRPLAIGANSLPAKVLGSTDVSDLATSLRYQPGYAAEVMAGYQHVIENMEPLEAIHDCVGDTTAGEIEMKIRKIALPVRSSTGGLLIFAFSEVLSLH